VLVDENRSTLCRRRQSMNADGTIEAPTVVTRFMGHVCSII